MLFDCLTGEFRFLLSQSSGPLVKEIDAYRDIAIACIAQLLQSTFFAETNLDREKMNSGIGQGFHGLLPYASQHWIEHVLEFFEKSHSFERSEDTPVVQKLLELCSEHSRLLGHQETNDTEDPTATVQDDRLQYLKKFPIAVSLIKRNLHSRQAGKITQGQGVSKAR